MTDLFINILNISISASWLILAVFILRAIFPSTPKWIVCLFWLIVGIRLVCPFTIESSFSLIPSAETIPTSITDDSIPLLNTGFNSIDEKVNATLKNKYINEYINSNSTLVEVPDNIEFHFERAFNIASVIWLIGVSVMLLYMLLSYFGMKHRLRTATLLYDNIYQSEFIKAPFVMGIIKPKIYIPYKVDLESIDQIVLHEKAHLKRRDNITKVIAFVLLSIYWFNPVIWLAFNYLCKDIEYATDEKVIKMMEHEEKQIYSKAILNNSSSDFLVVACPFSFGGSNLLFRIDKIINYKKPKVIVVALSIFLCFILCICFLTSSEIKSAERIDVSELDGAVVLSDISWSHEGDMENSEPDVCKIDIDFEYTTIKIKCIGPNVPFFYKNDYSEYGNVEGARYYYEDNILTYDHLLKRIYFYNTDNSVLWLEFYKDDELIYHCKIKSNNLTYDYEENESNEYRDELKYSVKIVDSNGLYIIPLYSEVFNQRITLSSK